MLITWYRSPSDSPAQNPTNEPPANSGPISPPVRMSPWHEAQLL